MRKVLSNIVLAFYAVLAITILLLFSWKWKKDVDNT
jgi:hypothetical protein